MTNIKTEFTQILHAAIATNNDKKKKKIITVTTKLSQRKKIQRKCEIEKKRSSSNIPKEKDTNIISRPKVHNRNDN